jgi:hypothetical protein
MAGNAPDLQKKLREMPTALQCAHLMENQI